MARLVAQLGAALRGLAAAPEAPVWRLELVDGGRARRGCCGSAMAAARAPAAAGSVVAIGGGAGGGAAGRRWRSAVARRG